MRLKLIPLNASRPEPPNPMTGRRILALGQSLVALGEGPLAGATLEMAGLECCADLRHDACDLLLIDADAWPAQALAEAIEALAIRPAPPVLMVGDRIPTGVVRSLLRLDRSDVLEHPFTGGQVEAAIAALMAASSTAQTGGGAGAGRCWAVSGAVGGAGATTIAIEIANALASRATRERSVCLIDLNLADGACAAYLGAQPAMRLADFSAAAERIDAAMLQVFVTPVTKRLDLLAAPRDPVGFDTVGREAVLRALEVACETYDWVIIDMPRHRRPWMVEALAGCDEVLVISELTVPALLAARALSDEIEAGLSGGMKPRIVLNRLASRMFGPAPSMAEAERALQRKAEAGISSDWEAAAASANLGGPIATHRPKSKIVKDVETLVERLAQAPARKDAGVRAA